MKRWYVAQVYAGYEEIVKKDLEMRIKEHPEVEFGRVFVPSAKLKNYFSFDQAQEDERLFPGYVLVEMEKTPETLSIVSSVPKVLKFLGGKDPVPLTQKEVDRIISQVKGDVVVAKAKQKSSFISGGEIDISEGPFAGFVGIIDKIDEETERLTVMVSIFGRLTPVELAFDQVKR